MTETLAIQSLSTDRAILEWMHDHAPYGVLTTDTELKVQSWNHWMASYTGRDAAEVLGRSLADLFPDLAERKLLRRFERAALGESSILSTALHGYLLRMDIPSLGLGEFREMQQTASIAPLLVGQQILGTIAVIEDVTHRELQAKVLRRQHERDAILAWALAHLLESREPRHTIRELFLKIAEHLDWEAYLLFLFAPDKQTLRLQSVGGITPEQAQALSELALSDPSVAGLFDAAEQCGTFGQSKSPQVPEILEKLGFSISAILPLRSDRESLGVLCFGARSRASLREGEMELLTTIVKYLSVAIQRELTEVELRAAQAKLNSHAENLELQVAGRTAELREIIAELERFSYSLAHDLRAPIRALRGYCGVLLEDFCPDLPDEAQMVIRNLSRACGQLDELTLDLLEFSKVSRADLTLETVDVEQVLAAALTLLPQGLDCVSIQRPLHKVRANTALLQQSVANLIDNALKFAKEHEAPKITIWTELQTQGERSGSSVQHAPFSAAREAAGEDEPPRIPNGTDRRGQVVRIFFEDQGIGIPAGLHQKIFGMFERGASSKNSHGSGIGLAIVARAAERMGGSCGVESVFGQGSRFWLELRPA